jgi:prenyltransferase beta subunit
MTGSGDMLKAARKGLERLGASRSTVETFLTRRLNPDGGFAGRAEASDLYYTAFGLDCLAALNESPTSLRTRDYVLGFGTGEGLDFMHLASLARCWSRLQLISPEQGISPERTQALLARFAAYSCPDGGYNTIAGAPQGSATANYLMVTVCQDLMLQLPAPAGILRSLASLRAADGAYANLPGLDAGTTLATAGVLTLQHWMNQPLDIEVAQWLLNRFTSEGGCLATPAAPIPDLLSTATAVFAFQTLGVDTSDIAATCLAFVDRLQQPGGGYSGHRFDQTTDCEYTFYALMTMGCLWEPGS